MNKIINGSIQTTHALIVGVERYSSELDDLDGPCLDAIRMCKFLVGVGVPQANITMIVSPLAKNQREVFEYARRNNIRTINARRDTVVEKINTEIPKISGDLLVTYWGGHAYVSAQRDNERRAFFANSPSNFDCTSFLDLLRKNNNLGHDFPNLQLCFFDVCANELDPTRVEEPYRFLIPQGSCFNRQQYAVFAAAPGERAYNNDSEQTGVFTDTLLKELEKGDWPPNVSNIHETIRRSLDGAQRPALFWYRDPSGSEWSTPSTSLRTDSLPKEASTNRAKELAKVKSGLGGNRLCWLHGIAGVGKSTLAQLVRADLGLRCIEIDCHDLTFQDLINRMTEKVSGSASKTGPSTLPSVRQQYGQLNGLLLLDNFESLINDNGYFAEPETRRLMHFLSENSPGLRTIATTRVLPLDGKTASRAFSFRVRGLSHNNAKALLRSVISDNRPDLVDSVDEIVRRKGFRHLNGNPLMIRMLPATFFGLPLEVALNELDSASDTEQFVKDAFLERLTPGEMDFLKIASVFLGQFTYQTLDSTCQILEQDTTKLPASLRALIAKGAIRLEGQPGDYSIHPLLRNNIENRYPDPDVHSAAAKHYVQSSMFLETLYHIRMLRKLDDNQADSILDQLFETPEGVNSIASSIGRYAELLSNDPQLAVVLKLELAKKLREEGQVNAFKTISSDLEEIDDALSEDLGEELAAYSNVIHTYLKQKGKKHTSPQLENTASLEAAYLASLGGNYRGFSKKVSETDQSLENFDPLRRDHVKTKLYKADLAIMKGDFKAAEQELTSTLKLFGPEAPLDIAQYTRHLGHANRFSLMFEHAHQIYSSIPLTDRPRALAGQIQTNIAETLCWTEPTLALESAEKAQELNQARNPIEVAKSEVASAIAHCSLGNLDESRYLANNALIGFANASYPAGHAFAKQALCVTEARAGNWDESEQHYKSLRLQVQKLSTYEHLCLIPAWVLGDSTTPQYQPELIGEKPLHERLRSMDLPLRTPN